MKQVPCVIFPRAEGDVHISYATAGRAQRDAAMTAVFATRFHWHPYPTLLDHLRMRIAGWKL